MLTDGEFPQKEENYNKGPSGNARYKKKNDIRNKEFF